MTSDAQRSANRRNALAATGPVTPAGRERSRLNRLRHGLTARAVMVLPDEDGEAFERLLEAMHSDLSPGDGLQEQLVERAALLFWRLARAARLETALFAYRAMVDGRARIRSARFGRDNAGGSSFFEPKSPMTEDEARDSADLEQGLAQALIAPAFLADLKSDNAFERLSRYERGLQRALETTLAALARERRLQPTLACLPPSGGTNPSDAGSC